MSGLLKPTSESWMNRWSDWPGALSLLRIRTICVWFGKTERMAASFDSRRRASRWGRHSLLGTIRLARLGWRSVLVRGLISSVRCQLQPGLHGWREVRMGSGQGGAVASARDCRARTAPRVMGRDIYGEDASLCWCTHWQELAFCPLTVSRGSRVVRELKLGRQIAQWHRGVKPRLGRDGCYFLCGWTMMVPHDSTYIPSQLPTTAFQVSKTHTHAQ